MLNLFHRIILVIASVSFTQVAIAQALGSPEALSKKEKADTPIPRCLEDYRGVSKRPKRVFVGVGTKILDVSFARHAQNLATLMQTEIERDQALKRLHTSASSELRITIETFPQGQIGSIEIDGASGSQELDNAVIALLKRSTPFNSFPQDVCMKADILYLSVAFENTGSGLRIKQPK